MKCNFVVGQKVVCVGDYSVCEAEEWAVVFGIEFPKLGMVYTVRNLVVRPYSEDDDAVGLLLDEVLNLPNPCHRDEDGGMKPTSECFDAEMAWFHEDFRPLATERTDISIFEAMLTPKNEKVAA
jgi:hypothetical protein